MPGCSRPSPPSAGPAPSASAVGSCAACQAKPVDPWIQDILAIMCPQDKAFLQDLKARGVTITAYDAIHFDDPYYDCKNWTTKPFEAAGTTSCEPPPPHIDMIRSASAEENAATVYHEGVHTNPSQDGMRWRDKEYDAYVKEDRWRISHGLPPHEPSFRASNGQTDQAAIKAFVDKEYPGVTSKPTHGAAPEQVVGKDPSGLTIVQRADRTTYKRKPKKGDSFSGSQTTVPPGGLDIDVNKLQCP